VGDQRDKHRLTRHLELLEAALQEARDPDEQRQLRNELLGVHRRFERLTDDSIDPSSTAPPTATAPGPGTAAAATTERGSSPGPERALPTPSRPGYYPDPFTNQGYERHFDGQSWSNGTHPTGGPGLDDLDIPEDQRTVGSDYEGGPPQVAPTRPGFYPDPFTNQGYERHFDGQSWSNGTHPIGGPGLEDLDVSEDERIVGSDEARFTVRHRPPSNRLGVTGFVLGLASIGLFDIGLIPILSVGFSTAALATHRPGEQSGRWMAVVGLILGLLYTLSYLVLYGHITL